MTQDYKRHGATTLFAALNAATREVIGKTYHRHRQQEVRIPCVEAPKRGCGYHAMIGGGSCWTTPHSALDRRCPMRLRLLAAFGRFPS